MKLAVIIFSLLTVSVFSADITAPVVTINTPTNGSTLSGTISAQVSSTDDTAVTAVYFMVDGARVSVTPDTTFPYTFQVDTTLLSNGTHTLISAATDAAGNVGRSSILTVSTINQIRYTLGSGNSVTNLGSFISANTQERQIMFQLPSNNDKHLLLYYNVKAYATYPLQVLDVNMTQGTARLTNGVFGRSGPSATMLHPNGKIYLGTGDPTGYLLEYDPITGATNSIGKLHPTVRRDAQVMDDGGNGWIYIGEYSPLGGGLARYNPTNSVFEDLGLMDTNYNAPQYSYTLGADTRYAYVGLGQSPWYLAIYDTQTTNTTLYWKEEASTSGTVFRAKNGEFYYRRGVTTSSNVWYKLESGIPTEVSAASVPAYYESSERTNLTSSVSLFATKFNMQINLDYAYPNSSSNYATVRWRTVGETNWQSASVGDFIIQPINVHRLYPFGSNQLFGFADFYGPVFSYSISNATTTVLGLPQYSLFDALFEPGRIYLSGYTASTLSYDTSAAWTLSGSSTNQATTNPRKISLAKGKYHYYSTFGADGLIYIGVSHIRDSDGGELGWYDPLTGTNGSLRTPFLLDDVRDLKPALGGTKMVYSSNTTNLFVFDVATKSIERTIVPLPGVEALNKIVEVAPGIMFGATGTNIFKVNIQTGEVLYTNSIPALSFGSSASEEYNHRLAMGPDGYVWMFIGNFLYRINPENVTMTSIISTPALGHFFSGRDIYFHGASDVFKSVNVLDDVPLGSRLNIATANVSKIQLAQ